MFFNKMISKTFEGVKQAEVNIKHNSADEPIDQHEYNQIEGQQIEWVNNFKYLGLPRARVTSKYAKAKHGTLSGK